MDIHTILVSGIAVEVIVGMAIATAELRERLNTQNEIIREIREMRVESAAGEYLSAPDATDATKRNS